MIEMIRFVKIFNVVKEQGTVLGQAFLPAPPPPRPPPGCLAASLAVPDRLSVIGRGSSGTQEKS